MELELKNICKSFQKKSVIHHLNIHMETGIIGLLGANGSGKTTLLRMLVGNLKPDKGEILWDGHNIQDCYDEYASVLGYMPQHLGMYPSFTVMEFLSYMALLKGLKSSFSKQRIHALLQELNLEEKAHKKIKTLSGGMLQRVGIAQALLNEPKILILDEPTAGLDPKERIVLRNLISHLSTECLVILSTHIVSDIESIADEIIVMKQGQVILQDTPDVILKTMENRVYEVQVQQTEAIQLEQECTIVNYRNFQGGQILRIVCDDLPYPNAIAVQPTLDDLYMYYFKEDTL